MSLPLKDFRMGITDAIYAALEARAAACESSMCDVARDVLEKWAEGEAHAYRVYARRVMFNGAAAEPSGPGLDDTGTRRSGRR